MLCLREALALENVNNKHIFLNKASDYEILNYVFEGKFPSEKYNIEKENDLLNELKIQIDSSYEINEMINENDINDLVMSLYPLIENNLTSSLNVLNFVLEKIDYNNIDRGVFNAYYNMYLDQLKSKAHIYGTDDNYEKATIDKIKEEARKKALRQAIINKGPIDKLRDKYDKVSDTAKDKYSKLSKDMKDKYSKLSTDDKNKMKYVGTTVLVAAALYGAYKIYKRFFTKAGKMCASYSGEEKEKCINKFKKLAIQKQIQELQKSQSKCSESNNPLKCKKAIEEKIKKLKEKINRL